LSGQINKFVDKTIKGIKHIIQFGKTPKNTKRAND
jgi:hypothetical protein